MAKRLNIFKRSELIEDLEKGIKVICKNEDFSLGNNFDGKKIETLYPLVLNTEVFYCRFTDTFNKIRPVEPTKPEKIISSLEKILSH